MDKIGIYNYLQLQEIWHEITEHDAVNDMAELEDLILPYPEAMAKNIFVRDDKKRNFYLITVKGDKRIDLKEFKQKYNTRNLSFASENYLMDVMGLSPGSVTPLGILNDKNNKVQVCLDREFYNSQELIGVHPNDNTATVWLKINDLVEIIKNHGNHVEMIDI